MNRSSKKNFGRTFMDITRFHRPTIVIIVETRINANRASRIIASLGYSSSYNVDLEGFSGGIWLLWKN
uniref:Uncharacterized protein n=1 Tax=Nelumbo nucifera TaxID=4432 RepID=A0A822ZEH4_NELNU|nr:TPA_asm: hypothetical protein HUJ06_001762 [Nelumbo nucifera]